MFLNEYIDLLEFQVRIITEVSDDEMINGAKQMGKLLCEGSLYKILSEFIYCVYVLIHVHAAHDMHVHFHTV